MDKPISTTLRTMFVTHLVVGLVFGLGFMVIPDTVVDLFDYPGEPDLNARLLGAAILGFSFTSLLGLFASDWQQVRIVVQAEILWPFLASVLLLWGLIDGTLSGLVWVNFSLMAFFFLGFGYCYWQEETVLQPRTA